MRPEFQQAYTQLQSSLAQLTMEDREVTAGCKQACAAIHEKIKSLGLHHVEVMTIQAQLEDGSQEEPKQVVDFQLFDKVAEHAMFVSEALVEGMDQLKNTFNHMNALKGLVLTFEALNSGIADPVLHDKINSIIGHAREKGVL